MNYMYRQIPDDPQPDGLPHQLSLNIGETTSKQ